MAERIIFCNCSYAQVLPAVNCRAVMEALLAADVEVEWVSDLCGLAAAGDLLLAGTTADTPTTICACHPRAVRVLVAAAGGDPAGCRVLDLRDGEPEALREELAVGAAPPRNGEPEALAARCEKLELRLQSLPPDGWHPWFPVIDRERCVDCGQCHEFCIFGAFAREADGTVRVAEPANCKINCPACARVCPQAAIVFPKYAADGPIAGGAGEAEEPVRVDIKRLLGKDPYAVLRARQQLGCGCRFGSQAEGADDGAGDAGPCPCELAGPDLLERLGVPESVLAENADEIRARLGDAPPRDDDG